MKYLKIVLLSLLVSLPVCSFSQNYTINPTYEEFTLFCEENSILYPDVVWAQARIESGNFTSPLYQSKCNCLGLYNSRKKEYYTYESWTDCLIGYRDKVQYRYNGSAVNVEEYLSWLTKIGYAATGETYLTEIRKILRRLG